VIVGKILDKDQYAYGFEAQSGEYVNMLSKGIIDPARSCVRRCRAGFGHFGRRTAHYNRGDGSRGSEQARSAPAMPSGRGMEF
jgi:chaperonin GroEL